MAKIITSFKNYMTEPSKCFIPKCKARCCVNAPLPEGFLPKHKDKIQLRIFSATNIGINDPKDTYNSIVYNTKPIQFIGYDEKGNSLVGIPPKIIEALQIKSMEQVNELLDVYKDILNYCPFITKYAQCSVYKDRPPICRDFGTDKKNPLNKCPEKTSRLEILKTYFKYAFDFKPTYNFIKEKFSTAFTKKAT